VFDAPYTATRTQLGVSHRRGQLANSWAVRAHIVRPPWLAPNNAWPTCELLFEALRQRDVVHADETGWMIGLF
jgi:hypothetical protein